MAAPCRVEVDGSPCGKTSRYDGWCQAHYARQRRARKLQPPAQPADPVATLAAVTLANSFLAHVGPVGVEIPWQRIAADVLTQVAPPLRDQGRREVAARPVAAWELFDVA